MWCCDLLCTYVPLKVLFIAFTYSVVGLSGIVSAITAAGGDLPPLYLYWATQDTTSPWSLDIERLIDLNESWICSVLSRHADVWELFYQCTHTQSTIISLTTKKSYMVLYMHISLTLRNQSIYGSKFNDVTDLYLLTENESIIVSAIAIYLL